MEMVAAVPNGGGASPFHNHDLREWSHVDSLTGVLERARRETDHWTANTSNSSHKYGKVVDSRTRSCADGNLQQEATRQLEVYQSQIPGSRYQVIKTNTVSSSKWTKKSSQEVHDLKPQPFEDLQFNANHLDVIAQTPKPAPRQLAGRRPLLKQSGNHTKPTASKYDDTPITSLHRVSRLCRQIHDSAVKQYIKKPSGHERQVVDRNAEINDVEINVKNNEHSKLIRTKSTSSEDLHLVTQEQSCDLSNEEEKHTKSIKDLEDLEKLRSWRRTSKLRRSLQLPKENKTTNRPPDLPENNGSVRRIREDLEKGRRLNTALRGNNVNLETLDQILQSISSPYASDTILGEVENFASEVEEEDEEVFKKQKSNSFVTVESIKEVRNRLRRTSSPSSDIYKDNTEESDDGIVSEISKMPRQDDNYSSKVRTYVYGMENSMSKISLNGTGSLESRSKHINGNIVNKNEDWYNRRKSYGFEKMHSQPEDAISKVKHNESSTDSGICRSSETVASNSLKEILRSREYEDELSQRSVKNNNWTHLETEELGNTVTIPIISKNSTNRMYEINEDISNFNNNWRENENIKRHSIAVDESQYVTKPATESKFRRTSLAVNTNDLYLDNEDNSYFHNRKPKKVEFCKTEVHFTAESGKVNIVETDEKPPPTNNFRRRRRNSGLILDQFNTNGLPAFKFGDDILNTENIDIIYNDSSDLQSIYHGLVTVTSNTTNISEENEDYIKENIDNELPKGILKNKPVKPKPYILGDTDPSRDSDDTLSDQSRPWDIKLKSVRDETPLWRSTVTVRNNSFGTNMNGMREDFDTANNYGRSDEELPEFQKLLKSLKPVSKLQGDCQGFCNSFDGIRIVSPNIDTRRSSWSVSDHVKHVEDLQLTEAKGYSTKINFGNGEATVIESNNSEEVVRHPTWPRREETSSGLTRIQNKADIDAKRSLKEHLKLEEQKNTESIWRKPSPEKFNNPPTKTLLPKTTNDDMKFQVKKLSSPALVGQNTINKQIFCDMKPEKEPVKTAKIYFDKNITKKDSLEKPKHKKLEEVVKSKIPNKEVLRQPKKSEMAYFGVPPSPKLTKTDLKKSKLSEKPDLLQFNGTKDSSHAQYEEHIYENVDKTSKKKPSSLKMKRDFDSNILEELTRAADQILEAVNEYANEDIQSKFSTDEDEKRKTHYKNSLDTISETKSWKQNKLNHTQASQNKNSIPKTKIKQTSSNSSTESVSRESKRVSTTQRTTSNTEQKIKRKTTAHENGMAKANTKARRLQRASSREALLQSHESSSEDLSSSIQVPARKPRVSKKVKSSQLVGSSNTESEAKLGNSSRKREDVTKTKFENRMSSSALPEIRHKTAVSTIRSTAEKAATKEKSQKSKVTESKKKSLHTQDSPILGSRGPAKCDRNKVSPNKDGNRRTSTSDRKKCNRYEASLK